MLVGARHASVFLTGQRAGNCLHALEGKAEEKGLRHEGSSWSGKQGFAFAGEGWYNVTAAAGWPGQKTYSTHNTVDDHDKPIVWIGQDWGGALLERLLVNCEKPPGIRRFVHTPEAEA